jgi:hypothetical protein
LVAELTRRGVTGKTAADLVKRHPAEAIAAKIEEFDFLVGKRDRKVSRSPAGYLVKSIDDNYAPPKGFVSAAERQEQAQARQSRERQAAEDRRRKQQRDAAEKAETKAIADYWESLTPERRAELDAASIAAADPATLAEETGPFQASLQRLRREGYLRQLLRDRQSG